jgi:hypothetical protein
MFLVMIHHLSGTSNINIRTKFGDLTATPIEILILVFTFRIKTHKFMITTILIVDKSN